MGKTNIEWTDFSWNGWIGCTRVSPGCTHCYAADLDKRRFSKTLGGATKENPVSHWGKGAPRQRTSAANWKQPLKWNKTFVCRDCGMAGKGARMSPSFKMGDAIRCASCLSENLRRPRVFCASLADWLDEEVPIEWLADLLKLIHDTPHLDWLLLTKRPENFHSRLRAVLELNCDDEDDFMKTWAVKLDGTPGWALAAAAWAGTIEGLKVEPPNNVWIGTTCENQEYADRRIPELLKIPARVRFLSCEPLLGALDIKFHLGEVELMALNGRTGESSFAGGIDWVICGGESGPGSRPMHPQWARDLRDQCAAAGVPYFFKQVGEWAPGAGNNFTQWPEIDPKRPLLMPAHLGREGRDYHQIMLRVGKKSAGRLLDGREHNEFPNPKTTTL